MIRIMDIIRGAQEVSTEIVKGLWVPARGVNHMVEPFMGRLKDAWLVLTRKADAVIWPEDDPHFIKREMDLKVLLAKRKVEAAQLEEHSVMYSRSPVWNKVLSRDNELCNRVRFILNNNMHNKTILKVMAECGGLNYAMDSGICTDGDLRVAFGPKYVFDTPEQQLEHRMERIARLIHENKKPMKLKEVREYLLISSGAIGRIMKRMTLNGMLYRVAGVGNHYDIQDTTVALSPGHEPVKFRPQHSDAIHHEQHLLAFSKNLLASPFHSKSKHWPVKIIEAEMARKAPDANAINCDPASTGAILGVRAVCLETGVQSEFVGGRHMDSCKRAMKWLASDISAIVGIKVWCATDKQENRPTSSKENAV